MQAKFTHPKRKSLLSFYIGAAVRITPSTKHTGTWADFSTHRSPAQQEGARQAGDIPGRCCRDNCKAPSCLGARLVRLHRCASLPGG